MRPANRRIEQGHHRPWACAILKVMHTLVYIQTSPLYKYQAQASETILNRFREVLRCLATFWLSINETPGPGPVSTTVTPSSGPAARPASA